MAGEYLTIILESEENAKRIINQAEEQAKKSMAESIDRKKEAFKQEEEKLLKDKNAYIEALQKDADAQIEKFIMLEDEIINKTKTALEKHKDEMCALVINYIKGKEKV